MEKDEMLFQLQSLGCPGIIPFYTKYHKDEDHLKILENSILIKSLNGNPLSIDRLASFYKNRNWP